MTADRPSPSSKYGQEAFVTAFRKFYRVRSLAVFGASWTDPYGLDADYSVDLDDGELGKVARSTLRASRIVGPDHPDWERVRTYWTAETRRDLLQRLTARAGVKTQSALYDGAGQVDLGLRDKTITLRPWRYQGRGGFAPVRGVEPTELPETVSDEELGATIRHLVDVSRRPWRY